MKKAIVLLAMGFVFSFCNTPGETTSTDAGSGAATGSTTMSSDTGRSGSTTTDTTRGRSDTTRPQ